MPIDLVCMFIPPELRFQRTLRKNRIPDIKNYIKNNANDYVFSSITVSVDGDIKFIPSNIDNISWTDGVISKYNYTHKRWST